MKKNFIVEREDANPKVAMAFKLFESTRQLEMVQVGTEILYNDSKYRVKRVETIFDTYPMYDGVIQDYINIYLEEI